MQRRIFLLLAVAMIAMVVTAVPAFAGAPVSSYSSSMGFTVSMTTVTETEYEIQLIGHSLDFNTTGVNQTVASQTPLSILNSGARKFDVYVSADAPPSLSGAHVLSFSDSPGMDQVRWTLVQHPGTGLDSSVTDTAATFFGTIDPGDGMALYSTVQMGTGLTYAGQYAWSATVYAVPAT